MASSISNDSPRSTSPISIDTQPTATENKYKDSKYNKSDYKLSKDIYIFENNLFTREILPIDYNKEREILVIQCTLCKYNKTVSLNGFQSSNFVQHYRNKHSNIVYNLKTEAILTLRNSIPTKPDFFNIESRKRNRTNTLIEFNENGDMAQWFSAWLPQKSATKEARTGPPCPGVSRERSWVRPATSIRPERELDWPRVH